MMMMKTRVCLFVGWLGGARQQHDLLVVCEDDELVIAGPKARHRLVRWIDHGNAGTASHVPDDDLTTFLL
jgi:hypothetical protein